MNPTIERHIEQNGGYCAHGHLWAVYGRVDRDGYVRCRECRRIRARDYRRRQAKMRRAR